MTDFQKYLAETGALPEDVILGRITLTRISDEPIRRDDLIQWFDEEQLNPALLPPPIKAVDAYRKATTEVEDYTYELEGNTATVLTRDVSSDQQRVIRHFIREIRDSRNRLLTFDKVGEAIFYRPSVGPDSKVIPGTERFQITLNAAVMHPGEDAQLDVMFQRCSASYDRYVNFLDGQKLRMVVREYQKYLNAIELKGGVYFVHANRTDELLRLQRVVQRFGGTCRMHLIPLVNLENERQMVVEAFQREATQALDAIVVEITMLRANRKKITPAAYAKMRARYDTVMNQASEYLRTLGITQETTAAAAEVALDALVGLQQAMYGVE